jgi:hypothetical protein
MIAPATRRTPACSSRLGVLTAAYEFTPEDHAIAVVRAAPHLVLTDGLTRDLPEDASLITLKRARRLVAELEATHPVADLLFAITRCHKQVCDCARAAHRRAGKAFASRVEQEIDPAGWVRADVDLPNKDAHFAHTLFDALGADAADARAEYRYDYDTQTVKVSRDKTVTTWRPLDIHRVELRHAWRTAQDVTMVLTWPETVAQTVVALWWERAARNLGGFGASTPLTAFAEVVAPLGEDPALHECLRELLHDSANTSEVADLIQVVLAAGVDDTASRN